MIKQLLDSDTCLKCRGCCRFSAADSVWTPLLSRNEQEILSGVCPGEPGMIKNGRLTTVPAKEGAIHYCVLFSPSANTCRCYEQRPLECRLYPFLINSIDGKAFLSVDMNCPFAREHSGDGVFKEYAAYLAEYLNSAPLLELLRAEKRLLQSYPGRMPELAEIRI